MPTDRWTHCQWYFQLARSDLSRGNRFDDRLSDSILSSLLSPFTSCHAIPVASCPAPSPAAPAAADHPYPLRAARWRTFRGAHLLVRAPATSLCSAFQCLRGGRVAAPIEGRVRAGSRCCRSPNEVLARARAGATEDRPSIRSAPPADGVSPVNGTGGIWRRRCDEHVTIWSHSVGDARHR